MHAQPFIRHILKNHCNLIKQYAIQKTNIY